MNPGELVLLLGPAALAIGMALRDPLHRAIERLKGNP